MENISPRANENKKKYRLYGRTLDVARTVVHYFMFVILGLIVSIPGPTLLDLRHSTGTDANSISYIFIVRSLGNLMGSLTGGFILDYMKNEQIALIISSFFVSMCAFLIPWCRSLTTLLVIFFMTGISTGFSNTGSNASCLRIWGKEGAPYLQGLHFVYGLGGFFAPLIAAYFLLKQTSIPGDLSLPVIAQNVTTELHTLVQNNTDHELKITISDSSNIPTITVAYTIIGILATFVFVCFIVVYTFSSGTKNIVENGECVKLRDPGLTFTAIVVILACLQTGFISGVEVSFTQMLTSYVVKSAHNLSKVTGSYMTSLYWLTFALTRGISIALACKINVKHLLLFDIIISITAAIILLTLATGSVPALWAGSALLGIGVASIYPASLSWIEKYININNRIASSFTIMSSILEMIMPLFISKYLESQPNVLFYFITAATISCCILFVILNAILNRKGEKYVQEETTTKEKAPNEQEESV